MTESVQLSFWVNHLAKPIIDSIETSEDDMSERQHLNVFDKHREPKRHDVAEMLLTGETVSWNDILQKVGNFSPRTMGYVLRGLEDQGATVLRLRDAEHGTLYRYDPDCEYDERYRLSKPDGPDAHRQKYEMNQSAQAKSEAS